MSRFGSIPTVSSQYAVTNMAERAILNDHMRNKFHQLQAELDAFGDRLLDVADYLELYELPLIEVATEQTEADDSETINVVKTHRESFTGRVYLKTAFCKLRRDPFKYSTYLAHRYPGFVVIPEAHKEEIIQWINTINDLKAEFKSSVKQNFRTRQAQHKNLHKEIEGLVFMDAVRLLQYSDTTVHTISLYWQKKTIQKRLSKEEALAELESGKNNPTFEYLFVDKAAKVQVIEEEKSLVRHIPSGYDITEIRQARVQPFYDLWERPAKHTRNRKLCSRNASLPVIIFGSIPEVINPLTSYCADSNERDFIEKIEEKYRIFNRRKSWFLVPKKKG